MNKPQDPGTPVTWVQKYIDAHPWWWRWVGIKNWIGFWCWTWLFDQLVWDFGRYSDGRLMHARTRRFLDADDPRHYGETDD